MKGTKVTFETDKLEYASELMRALAHPLRLKILEFIDQNETINVNKYTAHSIWNKASHLNILKY